MRLFNLTTSISPWLGLISTFTSILNKDSKEVMTLELGFSLFGYFSTPFFGSSLSLYFLSDPNFELEPPTSPKGPKSFSKSAMRMTML